MDNGRNGLNRRGAGQHAEMTCTTIGLSLCGLYCALGSFAPGWYQQCCLVFAVGLQTLIPMILTSLRRPGFLDVLDPGSNGTASVVQCSPHLHVVGILRGIICPAVMALCCHGGSHKTHIVYSTSGMIAQLSPPLFPLSLCMQRGPSTRSLPDSMQMLCTRNEDIIVAVFFDVKTCVTTSTENQGSVREFLNQARTYSRHYMLINGT